MVEMDKILEALRGLELVDEEVEGGWPSPPDPELVHRADPRRTGRGRQPTELPPDVIGELESLARLDDEDQSPELLDRLAWYAPLHFAGDRWGIYITEDAVVRLAGRICGRLADVQVTDPGIAAEAIRSAFLTLYFHEAFHHCTESFAIRLELTQKVERYRTYHRDVYRQPLDPDQPLEEALACADMIRRQTMGRTSTSVSGAVRRATVRMLKEWIPRLPAGYCRGLDFVDHVEFDKGKDQLSAMVQQGAGWSADDVRRWGIVAVHHRGGMFRALGTCEKHTHLVTSGATPRLPVLLSN